MLQIQKYNQRMTLKTDDWRIQIAHTSLSTLPQNIYNRRVTLSKRKQHVFNKTTWQQWHGIEFGINAAGNNVLSCHFLHYELKLTVSQHECKQPY